MTRLQAARALIDQARRERLRAANPRLNPDREPHPRRDYWRNYKREQARRTA